MTATGGGGGGVTGDWRPLLLGLLEHAHGATPMCRFAREATVWSRVHCRSSLEAEASAALHFGAAHNGYFS